MKPPKKERRIEERTVFVIRFQDSIALHRRAPKGLLAGLWEFPNVKGHLTPEEVKLLFPGQQMELLPDAKHIFSHVEWRMHANTLSSEKDRNDLGNFLPSERLVDNGENSLTFFTVEQISKEISVPSAFEAYRKYMEA